MATPYEYLFSYHPLVFNDVALGLSGTADITRYISGMKAENQAEWAGLLGALQRKLGKAWGGNAPTFTIPNDARIDAGEEFCKASIMRVFFGRSSPDEMRDVLRLAVWSGRITLPVTAAHYAQKWFGSDCNSFTGNYLGISPSMAIFAYARGYGSAKAIPGASPDVYASRARLPLPPVARPDEIATGDVLITFGTPDRVGNRWRHIALVESCMVTHDGALVLSLAEWGTKGTIDRHFTRNVKKPMSTTWRCPELPSKAIVSFDGTDPDGNPAKRIFFSAASLDDLPSRGWSVNGHDSV
ncbi:MAG: hypothetical protein MUE41_10745 [Gemmatimonadaceae bacterium]|jgi:hypothetical protein|nr:hypothetical protein [Gemmatimonadaceae bacterium]